ncbi:MAG: hypothetical protein GY768_03895 [Planctomycetaceae bacterium]|nr:hypothetical protein [Planctomycetaceae bacterium]
MQITDVQVNLCEGSEDRLRAYCAIVIDDEFVVHNIRIIEKSNGLLIAMPSRKLTLKCSSCRMKNPIDAKFCMTCGHTCDREEAARQAESKIHFDIAHPINPVCRQMIESAVLDAYRKARGTMIEKVG